MIDLTEIASKLPIQFYTLPPSSVLWPYVLVNCHRPEYGLRYLKRFGQYIREVIVDSGVEIFRNPSVKDYPGGYWTQAKRVIALGRRVKALCKNATVWLTTPDYPDDYHPRNLWLSDKVTNIERTIESVFYCVINYPSENWLISLQAHYGDPYSVLRSIELLAAHDFWFEDYEYYAVALTCQYKSPKIIAKEVEVAIKGLRCCRSTFRLHLFGPTIRVVPYLVNIQKLSGVSSMSRSSSMTHSANPDDLYRRHYVRRYISIDSTAYTKPVSTLVSRIIGAEKRFSCKSEAQRVIYFICYVARLCELCGRYDLAAEVLKTIGVEHQYGKLLQFLKG